MLSDRSFDLSPNGDAALDIRFSAAPGEQLSEVIIALAEAIDAASLTAITEVVPAYQCLTVCFDPMQLPHSGSAHAGLSELETGLRRLTEKILVQGKRPGNQQTLIRIPVCYDDEYAPDMQALCTHSGLTAEEIVSRHSAPHYLVHMLGFTPGFLYLGGLDTQLHCPRKARPELNVPAGSVGIGGAQTGIYPQATPGGWQIIGRTPLALFRPDHAFPYIAHPLDRVQFVAISAKQFAQIDPLSDPETTHLADNSGPEASQ